MLLRVLLVACLCQSLMAHSLREWWHSHSKHEYIYSENPNITEVLSQVNMDTPIVEFHNKLEADHFGARIDEVIVNRVYQVVGYTIGYPTLLVGDNDKLVMIDSPESYPQALRMLDDLRANPAVACKPIEAVIITLFHGDHIWGLKAFLEDPCNNGVTPAVYMHEKLLTNVRLFDTFKTFKFPRIFRMFGIFIPDPWHLHDGAADRILIQPAAPGPFVPTLLEFPTADTVVSKSIAGLDVEFHSIPGYTSDSIVTCFPLLKMCHGADVFYVTFANIYTLRGEPARDASGWANDARKIANLPNMDVFVATHTWSITGADTIRTTLNDFADAIQNVHDQTLRYMMKGYPADVITTKVHLPAAQAAKLFLHETYGLLETSVKSIVDFYVGWFSGYAEDIFPVTRVERTAKMIDLLSEKIIYREARRAYDQKEYRWAMEMISHLYNTDPTDRSYKELRALCMIRLAEGTPSVLSRHYLLSQVLEIWDLLPGIVKINTRGSLATLHLDGVLQNLQVHADAERLEAELSSPLSLYMSLTGGNTYEFTFRNSILHYAVVTAAPADALVFEITEASFRSYITTDPLDCASQGTATGGTCADVDNFFGYLDFQDEL